MIGVKMMVLLQTNFDVFNELQNIRNEEVVSKAWTFSIPGLSIGMLILTVIGIFGLFCCALYLACKGFLLIIGKATIGKKQIKELAIAVTIFLLISGPGIFKVLSLANEIAVNPSVELMEQNNKTTEKKDSGGN